MASMTKTVATAQEEPFFLVGSERSGTTLLRLMLAHHQHIECAPEFEFLVEEMPDGSGWPQPDLSSNHLLDFSAAISFLSALISRWRKITSSTI